jgi:hypothetical protein
MSGNKSGFAGLVRNALDQKRNSGQDEQLEVNKGPSKGLPSTGLKKNTLEWQESNGSGKGTPKDDKRPSSSRQTSSSSIPSDADGDDDSRTDAERNRDQEGPLGRGPGQHEKEIKANGDNVYDSPEEDDMPSIPAPRGSVGDGAATPAPPGYFQERTKKNLPDNRGEEEGKEDKSNGSNGIDPEERVLSRNDKKVSKRFTDEAGHYPEGLPQVKDEAPPGSQNEIVLNSRAPVIHVSPLLFDDQEYA